MDQFGTAFPTEELAADLCVVGGGMAGLCAALAAAREGARTVLLQDRPVLGGNASSEVRMWICGAHGAANREGGILEELFLRNRRHNPWRLYPAWDHVLYGACLEQAGLTTLLNCAVHDLELAGGRIGAVRAWHLTRQRHVRVRAHLFADCSGDAVLRASGAETRWGREARDEHGESHAPPTADRKTMGNSILIQLRETDRHVPFVPPPWAIAYTDATAPRRNLRPDGDNFWWLEIGGTRDTIADADAIRDDLLRIAYGVWAYIKNHPDGRGHRWELDWIGSLPGKRENVRYVGDHVLSQNDVEAGGPFADVVAYGGWSMDDHHPDAIEHPGEPTVFHPAPSPYGIPYRCLYARSVPNLLVAGRCISATHMALSSTRVMATCALLGQAVGTAAAIGVRDGLDPRQVGERRLAELQARLQEQDCWLPGRGRILPDLMRAARLEATAPGAERLRDGIERDGDGSDHACSCGPDDVLTWTWERPVTPRRLRLVFDSDFARGAEMLCRYPRNQEPATMPGVLARAFVVEGRRPGGGWAELLGERDNLRRLVILPLSGEAIDGIRLRVLATWGDGPARVFAFDVDDR